MNRNFSSHLSRRNLLPADGRDIFGDFADVIDHALFVVQRAAFLVVITDMNGLPDFDFAAVGFDSICYDFQQRCFTRTVFADNSDAVVAFQQIRKNCRLIFSRP